MVKALKLPGNHYALFVAGVSFLITLRSLNIIVNHLVLSPSLAKAGIWQFLTNLSLAFSFGVFGLNIILQITRNIHIFHLKNELHAIAFTLESIVSIVYWPLRIYFIDRIKSKDAKMIPLSLDLSIHLLPVVSLALDYYLFMPQWRIKNSHAYLMCITLGTGYWFLLEGLMDETSVYPYPFLQVETKPRILIFALVIHISYANFYIQRKIHDLIIGKEVDDTYDKDK